MKLSIILPVLNEASAIVPALQYLQPLRLRGHQVIVADGGSSDATAALAAPLADRVIESARGRARQMNAGAAAAQGDVVLFLHVDTRLPPGADAAVAGAMAAGDWGRFDVAIDGGPLLLSLVAFFMNWRSRLTGIATGDQAIFVRRSAFRGFPDIPLMEDVAFCNAMKRSAPPACLRQVVVTSGRRWERNGVVRTVLLMWRLRLAYWLGASPDELARRYAKGF